MVDRHKNSVGVYADRFLRDGPGSLGAVRRGCICPEAENNFGRGRTKHGVLEPSFATDPECPLHGIAVLIKMLAEKGGSI
jgi:hypothetical protein